MLRKRLVGFAAAAVAAPARDVRAHGVRTEWNWHALQQRSFSRTVLEPHSHSHDRHGAKLTRILETRRSRYMRYTRQTAGAVALTSAAAAGWLALEKPTIQARSALRACVHAMGPLG